MTPAELVYAALEGAAALAAAAAALFAARALVRRTLDAEAAEDAPDPELTREDLAAELLDELRRFPGPRAGHLAARLARRHGLESRVVAEVLTGLRTTARVRLGRGLRLYAVAGARARRPSGGPR